MTNTSIFLCLPKPYKLVKGRFPIYPMRTKKNREIIIVTKGSALNSLLALGLKSILTKSLGIQSTKEINEKGQFYKILSFGFRFVS